MPKYDFAHPKFNHGYVEFPEKKTSLFDSFCDLARQYRVNVIRAQMIVTTKNYTARVYNRFSYIEIRNNGKVLILHDLNEIENYFRSLT